jgi:hypothetical protein
VRLVRRGVVMGVVPGPGASDEFSSERRIYLL